MMLQKSKKRFSAAVIGSAGLALALGQLALGSHSTDAYVVNGQSWANGASVNQSDPSWPAAWDGPATNAEQAWNNVGTSFRFSTSAGSANKLTTSNQGNTGTLGTSNWSYTGSGTITQAGTVINTYYRFNPTDPNAPGVSGTYDIQSVMTHELGHWLSLGHSSNLNTDGSRPVMYPSFAPGEIRTVGSDDAAGMRAIYSSTQSGPTPTKTATASPSPTSTSTPTPSSSPAPATPTPVPTNPPAPNPIPVSICQFLPSWPGCGNATIQRQPAGGQVTVSDHALVAENADSLSKNPAVSRIVIGTVRELKPSVQAGGVIYTDAIVDVRQHLLGGSENQVVVRNLGGTVGNQTTISEDSPSLKAGETVLLFLSREGNLVPLDANTFYVRGLVQGAYHLNGQQAVSELPDRSQSLASLQATIQAAIQHR